MPRCAGIQRVSRASASSLKSTARRSSTISSILVGRFSSAAFVNAQLDPRYRPMLVREIEDQIKSTADSLDEALNHREYTVILPSEEDARPCSSGSGSISSSGR